MAECDQRKHPASLLKPQLGISCMARKKNGGRTVCNEMKPSQTRSVMATVQEGGFSLQQRPVHVDLPVQNLVQSPAHNRAEESLGERLIISQWPVKFMAAWRKGALNLLGALCFAWFVCYTVRPVVADSRGSVPFRGHSSIKSMHGPSLGGFAPARLVEHHRSLDDNLESSSSGQDENPDAEEWRDIRVQFNRAMAQLQSNAHHPTAREAAKELSCWLMTLLSQPSMRMNSQERRSLFLNLKRISQLQKENLQLKLKKVVSQAKSRGRGESMTRTTAPDIDMNLSAMHQSITISGMPAHAQTVLGVGVTSAGGAQDETDAAHPRDDGTSDLFVMQHRIHNAPRGAGASYLGHQNQPTAGSGAVSSAPPAGIADHGRCDFSARPASALPAPSLSRTQPLGAAFAGHSGIVHPSGHVGGVSSRFGGSEGARSEGSLWEGEGGAEEVVTEASGMRHLNRKLAHQVSALVEENLRLKSVLHQAETSVLEAAVSQLTPRDVAQERAVPAIVKAAASLLEGNDRRIKESDPMDRGLVVASAALLKRIGLRVGDQVRLKRHLSMHNVATQSRTRLDGGAFLGVLVGDSGEDDAKVYLHMDDSQVRQFGLRDIELPPKNAPAPCRARALSPYEEDSHVARVMAGSRRCSGMRSMDSEGPPALVAGQGDDSGTSRSSRGEERVVS